VSDKLGKITILSLDEGSYRFFSDISSISCEQVEGVEGHYSNCSDKEPIELKPKEQGFDEAAEIVFDRTETSTLDEGERIQYFFGVFSFFHFFFLVEI
jgi:hypothetical protein